MASLDLSQAALARRVGVSQQSIARLVSGEAMGSRYLHLIARELHTTPAYLSGETSNPDADLPDEFLSSEERGWIRQLRALAPKDRQAVMTLTHSLASSTSGSVNASDLDYQADN